MGEIIDRVRALPVRQRLKLIELVVHDLAEDPEFTDNELGAGEVGGSRQG